MAIDDVLILTDTQTYTVVNEVLNVYAYLVIEGGGTAQDLVNSYVLKPLPQIAAVQRSDMVHTRISAINLFDPTDTGETLISVVGTDAPTSETLPPHSNVTMTYFPSTKEVRPGRKAYAGIAEANQNDGILIGSPYLALLSVLKGVLIEILKDAATSAIERYTPIIIKRIREGTAPNFTYRLPANQTESTPVTLTDIDFPITVNTQNTRKLNRN